MIIACIKCKTSFQQGDSQYRCCPDCRNGRHKGRILSTSPRAVKQQIYRKSHPERNIIYQIRKTYQNPLEWIAV